MESKQLLQLKGLKKSLRKLLKKYSEICDFIIFGSMVKGSIRPKDTDIAMISISKNPAVIGEVKTLLDKHIAGAHLQTITYEDFIKSKLPYYILAEGYSVKEKKLLSKVMQIKRQALYWFELADLPQNKKAMFNKGLRNIITTTGAEKIGRGVILVGINDSGEVEDFLNEWQRKIKKKEFIQI